MRTLTFRLPTEDNNHEQYIEKATEYPRISHNTAPVIAVVRDAIYSCRSMLMFWGRNPSRVFEISTCGRKTPRQRTILPVLPVGLSKQTQAIRTTSTNAIRTIPLYTLGYNLMPMPQ